MLTADKKFLFPGGTFSQEQEPLWYICTEQESESIVNVDDSVRSHSRSEQVLTHISYVLCFVLM